MPAIEQLFQIDAIAFEWLNYPISYVELIGTFFGMISVYFAARANILTWPTGILNEVFLFALFFQVQLYADMFLQVYFLGVTVFGWYNWQRAHQELAISRLARHQIHWLIGVLATAWIATGIIISKVHIFLPAFFPERASYPFADSLVMVFSIAATLLLARKKLESWLLWIIVDGVAVVLFVAKGILFLAAEYLIFLGLAIYGYFAWHRKSHHD